MFSDRSKGEVRIRNINQMLSTRLLTDVLGLFSFQSGARGYLQFIEIPVESLQAFTANENSSQALMDVYSSLSI